MRKTSVETGFERGLFASRWLMAPMYLGLVVSLGMLTVIFVKELLYYLPKTFSLGADQAILAVLTLIGALLMLGVIVTTLFTKEFHTTTLVGVPFLIVLILAYTLWYRKK